MKRMPVVFLSHGSPMLSLETHHAAHTFLAGSAAHWPRPKAILAISPHWHTAAPTLGAVARPETIHDFYGFPPALHAIQYPVAGDPELAQRAKTLLDKAGWTAGLDGERGLDHGAWAPLRLAYPAADIPIVQMSQQTHLGPAYQMGLGQALAPLRDEGVLIYASGTMTHNNFELDRSGRRPVASWARDFAEWVADRLAARDDDALLDYRRRAPSAERNHPQDDHLLPLYVALGAATPGLVPTRLHASFTYSSQAMDAYRFD